MIGSVVEGVAGARSIELVRGVGRSIGHQEPSSRPHELVHHAEHEHADQHEYEGGHHLGERVQPALGVLLGPPRGHALLRGQAAGQRGEGQALGEGQLVQGLREGVGAHGAAGRCPQQGVFQVQGVEHAVPVERNVSPIEKIVNDNNWRDMYFTSLILKIKFWNGI